MKPKYVQFKLRVRVELRDEIRRAANRKGISANREAVNRLEASLLRETESWRQFQAVRKEVMEILASHGLDSLRANATAT